MEGCVGEPVGAVAEGFARPVVGRWPEGLSEGSATEMSGMEIRKLTPPGAS